MTIDEIKEYREAEKKRAERERELLIRLAEQSRNMSMEELLVYQCGQMANHRPSPYVRSLYAGYSPSLLGLGGLI